MRVLILIFAVLLTIVACNKSKQDTDKFIELQPAGEAWGALYQQRAEEYKALCYQAYNLAKLRLDEKLKTNLVKPLAIITDIDETVLDNSPYFVQRAQGGQTYSDSSWVEWTSKMRCDTVPGAANFLKYASEKGVEVFYITNRFQRESVPTMQNLKRWGLPNVDTTHLILLKTSDSSKELRRLSISKDYEIALLIGDNLGDFSKDFDHLELAERTNQVVNKKNLFGDKFIVLPNSIYGTWEDGLYKTIRLNSLKEKNKQLNYYLEN